MKSFLDWAKSNLVVSIILAVAIIGIPVMIFFSGRWNASVRKAAADEAGAQSREISAVSSTNYTIPAIIPGQQEVTVAAPPNKATTDYVRRLRQELTQKTEAIRGEAVEWNQRDKQALFASGGPEERLFPAPANESARLRLTKSMIRVWPEEHRALLERYHVGQPPEPGALAADLQRVRDRERSALVEGRVDQNLTPEEAATIDQTLQRARTQRYHDAASRFTVYGNMEMFKAVKPLGEAEVPSVETLWDWQHILWIHTDVLKAIYDANSVGGSGETAVWQPVYDAPVKRILSIDVQPRDVNAPSRGGDDRAGRDGFEDPTGAGDAGGAAGPGQDFAAASTGRAGWPRATNPVYDARNVTIEVIVASDRMPELLDAIARTNFMTVIDMDIEAADAYDALRQGYDFGPDHVVKATLTIETIWIHAWMKGFMPPAVRTALGVPADPAATPAAEEL